MCSKSDIEKQLKCSDVLNGGRGREIYEIQIRNSSCSCSDPLPCDDLYRATAFLHVAVLFARNKK